ncbi:hypothetical protein BO86DRAFT_3275 [Aspergillus japonicus CBS 114.51]|uniref:Uncharacterized protein n=1 Tax=Aspergillus japonicus CBS 114.51 TaxID=1448312 RepID=A0A8T8XHD8_ASPJA|nr:hypothetical protein BO86DRAFT_3275 [Aspergillus japonicus CBS 114.51]RAH87450.1 hypothetical protein BO86DRAFT_3275 [Aspergillus japonicus CBS 114.51]
MDFAKVDRRRNADWSKSSGCNHGAGREKRVRGATANENRCTPVELPDNVFTVGPPINKPALVLGGSWGVLGGLGGGLCLGKRKWAALATLQEPLVERSVHRKTLKTLKTLKTHSKILVLKQPNEPNPWVTVAAFAAFRRRAQPPLTPAPLLSLPFPSSPTPGSCESAYIKAQPPTFLTLLEF